MRSTPVRAARARLLTPVVATAVALLVAVGALVAAPAQASTSGSIERRAVVFRVVNNSAGTGMSCGADGLEHEVRGTLIGTRDQINGYDGGTRVNALVHDAGTGAWFWNMPSQSRYDYAGGLARAGELVLVIDRLGYDRSGLRDGRSTCLGAQVNMLHQVVQQLYSGKFRFAQGRGVPPHALSVVLHGHGTGAAIAQNEAGRYDDVDGVVLMSWADGAASSRATQELSRQRQQCSGRTFATFGATSAAFRGLLFASAPSAVRTAAVERRNDVPCGDVNTQGALVGASASNTRRVAAPVLLLFGSRDTRLTADAAQKQARSFPRSSSVRTRTFTGAGSALPLESQAPQVRRTVVDWLRAL